MITLSVALKGKPITTVSYDEAVLELLQLQDSAFSEYEVLAFDQDKLLGFLTFDEDLILTSHKDCQVLTRRQVH